MTKIDIISGFLGAGKTTLIKKLLTEALVGEKVVLIENEFGEIGIDGGFLKDAGIRISEMNSGCICCSLVGDFEKSLTEVLEKFKPDRIIIEPSGVGKLSDIIAAVENLGRTDISLNSFTTVVDAKKCKTYLKNFGEFFCNQVENARAIILSRSQDTSEDKIAQTLSLLREHNTEANIVTAPWDELDGKQILSAMENAKQLKRELEALASEHHHGHDDEDDDEHEHHCHCHDHDDEDEHEHHCHHHDHGDEDEHEHHCHHHGHGDEDEHDHHCHCHGHHHHGHDADEVFTSIGFETVRKYTEDEVRSILEKLNDSALYGTVLRSKGILPAQNAWIHFDFVPEELSVRTGSAETIGKICIIGADLNEDALKQLFRI